MSTASLQSIASLLASLFTFSVACLVFFRGSRRSEVYPFVVICFLISIWTLFPFAVGIAKSEAAKTFVGRGLYLAAPLVPAAFSWLISGVLQNRVRRIKRVLPFLWIVSAGLFLVTPTPWMISAVKTTSGLQVIVPGFLYHFFVGYFVIACAYTFIELYLAILRNDGIKRNHLYYYMSGFLMAYIAGTLHFISMYLHFEPMPHDVFVTGFISILAYAIVKHRVMDLNLAARYLLIKGVFGLIVGLPTIFLVFWIKDSVVTVLAIMALALGGPTFFQFIRDWLTEQVDSLPFFRGRYERFSSLENQLKEIGKTKTIEDWGIAVRDVAVSLFPARIIALLIKDEHKKRYLIKSSYGMDQAASIFTSVPMDSLLVRTLLETKAVLIMELAQKNILGQNLRLLEADLQFLQATVCVPLFLDTELFAILSMGEKTSGESYNDLELTSLSTMARSAEHALQVIISGLTKEQLTTVWAHDLLKPFSKKGSFQFLNEISKGSLDLLGSEIKSKIELVLMDANYLRQNIHRLLTPGKVESFHILPCSLAILYRRMEIRFKGESLSRNISFKVDPPSEGIRVFCDLENIEHRVFLNLIENAFRYTSGGGAIYVGYKIQNGHFIGIVRDTGIGIRKENLEKIFSAYTQLEDGRPGLSGMGLYSARSVIEAHHGKIWVESVFGEGAAFFFELPLAAKPREETIK